MEFLGIGPLELVFIVLLALIILGPKDMIKTGRSIGRFLRKTILSPTWISIQRKMRNLPTELMREVGLEEADLKVKPEDLGISKDDLGIKPEDLSINIDPKLSSPPLPLSSPVVSPVPAATVATPKQEPTTPVLQNYPIPVEDFASFPEPPAEETPVTAVEETETPAIEQASLPENVQDSPQTVVERDSTGIRQDSVISGIPKPAGIPENHSSENPNGSSDSSPANGAENDQPVFHEVDQTTEPEQS
ncbi:MAG: twin-arginine translocase TatA/TatE family subunit [Omnitrophica WOR_2 bacterium]